MYCSIISVLVMSITTMKVYVTSMNGQSINDLLHQ